MARKKYPSAPSVKEAITPTLTPPPRDLEGRAAWLCNRYDRAVLTIPETAHELGRTEDALRVALWSRVRQHQQHATWIQRLLRGRISMGRRSFFDVHAVADVLLHGDQPIVEPEDEEVMS